MCSLPASGVGSEIVIALSVLALFSVCVLVCALVACGGTRNGGHPRLTVSVLRHDFEVFICLATALPRYNLSFL